MWKSLNRKAQRGTKFNKKPETQGNQAPPPPGYPTDQDPPTKKGFMSRTKKKGERGFIEGCFNMHTPNSQASPKTHSPFLPISPHTCRMKSWQKESRLNAVICERSMLQNIIVALYKLRNLNLSFLNIIPKILKPAYILDLPIQSEQNQNIFIRFHSMCFSTLRNK
ncbi:hypothetical protein Ahy_B06g080358 [Arachis hypogaea]|uniref:Uncharacterized protein n=1 Tax=Arachis hypogaea TaxID=3818 RepID=A0A444YHS2_ARAHY|nr:hypothetical protein Ahy_B06g080358 [Arachis hypogaea]